MAMRTDQSSHEGLARLVWATCILRDLERRSHAPLSIRSSEKTSQPSNTQELISYTHRLPAEEDFPDDVAVDDIQNSAVLDELASQLNAPLTSQNESIRHKFLVYLAQILSAAKGGHFVVATALREFEDNVEIDVASNDVSDGEQQKQMKTFYSSFERFMAAVSSASSDSVLELQTRFLEEAIEYGEARLRVVLVKLQDRLRLIRDGLRERSNQSPRFLETTQLLRCLLENANKSISILQLKDWSKAASKVSDFEDFENIVSSLGSGDGPSCAWQANFIRSIRLFGNPGRAVEYFTRVARSMPQFGRCRIKLRCQTESLRLAPNLRISLERAWSALCLPQHRTPRSISSRKFRDDCSKSLHVHAEMQLLCLYETSPKQMPTTRFIGLSKKACLLCEVTLSMSSSKLGVWGRHGKLYPRWTLPVGILSQSGERLHDITEMVCARILQIMTPGIVVTTTAVAESTVVPKSTVTERKHQTVRQNHIKNLSAMAEQHRRRQRLIEDPTRSVQTARHRNKRRNVFDEDTQCLICCHPAASPASCCKLVRYCSEECRKIDSSGHEPLCRQLKHLSTRPSRRHYRAVLFPADESEAQWIWLENPPRDPNWLFGHIRQSIWEFLGPSPVVDDYSVCHTNLRRGYDLRDSIFVHCRADADDSPWNLSINSAIGEHDRMGYDWCGPIVVTCALGKQISPSCDYRDLTLVDLRTVLDHLATYWDQSVRSFDTGHGRSSNMLLGVRVLCEGEQQLHGADDLQAVEVPLRHHILGGYTDNGIPFISKCIGVPLTARRMNDREFLERDRLSLENPIIEELFYATSPSKRNGGGFKPKEPGNVLLIRLDREDLTPKDVRKIYNFCMQTKEIFDSTSADGTTGAWMTFMDYITPERFKAYKTGNLARYEDIAEEAIVYSNSMKQRFGYRHYEF